MMYRHGTAAWNVIYFKNMIWSTVTWWSHFWHSLPFPLKSCLWEWKKQKKLVYQPADYRNYASQKLILYQNFCWCWYLLVSVFLLLSFLYLSAIFVSLQKHPRYMFSKTPCGNCRVTFLHSPITNVKTLLRWQSLQRVI